MQQVGKTTMLRLLTNSGTSRSGGEHVGMARVPDNRIDALRELYHPRKTTYASIEVIDIAGFLPGQAKRGSEFLQAVRDVDAIVQVVRAFHSPIVATADGEIRPLREIDQVQAELILADWALLETRRERLQKQRMKTPVSAEEISALDKFQTALENDLPLRTVKLNEAEALAVRGYGFLTRKPLLLLINVDDAHLQGGYPQQEAVEAWSAARGIPLIVASAQVEMEINQLDPDDATLFMQELGLHESGVARLAQAVYAHLGLISFFTVGEDEVRAWTIRANSPARQAAGKIHSDIERGFIRAEVCRYDHLAAFRSMQALKEKGLWHLEGKDYTVADGDIISFRFNV